MNEFDRAGDWDLQAIVKGQTTSNISGMPTSCAWLGSLGFEDYKLCQENAAIFNQVEEVRKPSYHEIPTEYPPNILNNNDVMTVGDYAKSPTTKEQEQKSTLMAVSCAHSGATSSRRRRKKHKKVTLVHHAAGDPLLSSDNWNWRKYGEKAIKGSRYPRSYYRCSSSGECLARKQVEQSNPGMFLITYIDEHNHPNPTRRHSQAGLNVRKSTASAKFVTTSASTNMSSRTRIHHKIIRKNPVLGLLAQQGNKDDARVEDIGEVFQSVLNQDMAWEDDFFAGLEYLEGLELDLISDHIPFDPFPSNVH